MTEVAAVFSFSALFCFRSSSSSRARIAADSFHCDECATIMLALRRPWSTSAPVAVTAVVNRPEFLPCSLQEEL